MKEDSSTVPAEDGTPTPEAVRVLVDNHRSFLAFLERRVGNRAIAEDILQEAFTRSLGKIESLRSEESAVAWFYRMLRNAVIDHHRRGASRDRGLEAFATELAHEDVASQDMQNTICQCVGELASTLKPEYASALRRVEIDGVAVKDYAEEAGISSNNGAVRLFRAREALRKQVARACGTCADHGCLDCTCSKASTKGHAGCGQG